MASPVAQSLRKDVWFKLQPHPVQTRLLLSRKRYKCVVAGRGSGKTELARRYLLNKMLETKPWPNPMYFYVTPTADQGRRLAWNPILRMIPEDFYAVKGRTIERNEGRMYLKLRNGAELHVLSGEKPERAEGVQWDGGIFDECSDLRPGIFGKNFGPAMTHRNAWAWRIGVPKRRGIGAVEFKEFYDRGVRGDPYIDSFTWHSSTILSPEAILERKNDLSPQDYREQYEASWETNTGLVFPDFDDNNISDKCVYHPGMPIIVGMDFNVNPMSWVLCHLVEENGKKQLQVFDEVYLKGTNTNKALDFLYSRYPLHKRGWVFIGDASSRARKTSASASDYLQIHNDTRFENRILRFPNANPPVADRITCVNASICNALGERRIKVHPSCKNLIRDLRMMAYEEESSEIDKSNWELGHLADAIGYVIWQVFPLEILNKPTGPVIFKAT